MEKLRVEGHVARTGDAHAQAVTSIVKTKRLFTGNAATPIESDGLDSRGENHVFLQRKGLSGRDTVIIKIHIDGVGLVGVGRDRCGRMPAHSISARPLDVRGKLSRRIRKAEVRSSSRNAYDRKSGDHSHDRQRDNQLHGSETFYVFRGRHSHNSMARRLSSGFSRSKRDRR